MTIFKLRYETFSKTYISYWSSLDKAFQRLPQDYGFKQWLHKNGPHYFTRQNVEYTPDHDYNQTLPPSFHPQNENNVVNVVIEGARFKTRRKISIPEVKVEGAPYKAAHVEYELLDPQYEMAQIGIITYERINVDEVKE